LKLLELERNKAAREELKTVARKLGSPGASERAAELIRVHLRSSASK
jgi:hypothetical protein